MLKGVASSGGGSSQTLIQLSTGLSTADQNTVKSNLSLPPYAFPVHGYTSGHSVLAGYVGMSVTPTNTNTMATNTIYGTISPIVAPVSISALGFKTSSSNASVGASAKFAIYNTDASGLPTTLVGQTSTGVSITDASLSTIFQQNLDAAAVLQPGMYLFCILCTTTTTAARASTFQTSAAPYMPFAGNTTAAGVMNNTAIFGYQGTATYATGFPSNFPTPTAVSGVSNAPALFFVVT